MHIHWQHTPGPSYYVVCCKNPNCFLEVIPHHSLSVVYRIKQILKHFYWISDMGAALWLRRLAQPEAINVDFGFEMIKKPIGKLARKIKKISIYMRFRLDGTQPLATFFFLGVLDCAAISASATWENHQPWELQTLPFFSSAVPSTSIWKSPSRIPNHFKLLLASRPREMPQSILLWPTLFH